MFIPHWCIWQSGSHHWLLWPLPDSHWSIPNNPSLFQEMWSSPFDQTERITDILVGLKKKKLNLDYFMSHDLTHKIILHFEEFSSKQQGLFLLREIFGAPQKSHLSHLLKEITSIKMMNYNWEWNDTGFGNVLRMI